MKNRREALGALAASAATFPDVVFGNATPDPTACLSPGADYFPNIAVTTHLGQRALFYDDLLAGRTVMINFMSIAGESVHPVTRNLAKAQKYLGDRLGRDIFIYSLTVDPKNDTPRALSTFAARHGAKPGWLFLTGQPEDLQLLRGRFFVDRVGGHHAHGSGPDCSLGLIRYGNEARGLWGSCPNVADPRWIAGRLTWIAPQPMPSGPPRRGGPFPLGARAGLGGRRS